MKFTEENLTAVFYLLIQAIRVEKTIGFKELWMAFQEGIQKDGGIRNRPRSKAAIYKRLANPGTLYPFFDRRDFEIMVNFLEFKGYDLGSFESGEDCG